MTTAHIWSCPENNELTANYYKFGLEIDRAILANHRRTCAACQAARAELDAEAEAAVHPAHDTPDPGPGTN